MPKVAQLLAAGVLCLVATVPAQAQQSGFKELLFNSNTPSTVRMKELTPEGWRHVTIVRTGDKKEDGGGMMGMLGGMMGGMFGGGAEKLLETKTPRPSYTQGQTVTVGTETYLVVYQLPLAKGLDLATLIQQENKAKLPPPEKMTGDTVLNLTLINVRSIETLADVRAFNLEHELAEHAKGMEAEAKLRDEFNKNIAGDEAVAPPIFEEDPPNTILKPAPKKPAPKKPAGKAAPKRR